MHTELAFAYNQGADIGVKRAIRQGLMSRCAMIWSTAGTNRVCARCLALKDTVVGYTDEVGVQIPPLHCRCRCAIIYEELPQENKKPNKPPDKPSTELTQEAIRERLAAMKTELKIKGELIYPPPKSDLSEFKFDAAHTPISTRTT